MLVYKKNQPVYKKRQTDKAISFTGSLLFSIILVLLFSSAAMAKGGERYHTNKAWSFGVMGDTRWVPDDDPNGDNPNHVSVSIASALNDQFIDYGVKFVIQLGDLSDRAGNDAMYTRAEAAQPLYDAGIGFFPMRGNHETYGASYGLDPDSNMNIPAYLDAFPQTRGMNNTFGATNFSSPEIDELNGLSYAFDYGIDESSARFVIVDVEATSSGSVNTASGHPLYGQSMYYIIWDVYQVDEDITITEGDEEIIIPANTWFRIDELTGNPTTYFYEFDQSWPIDKFAVPNEAESSSEIVETRFLPGDQQDWINEKLDIAARGTEHAFILSHRGLIGPKSMNSIFGDSPDTDPEDQNIFYASLLDNGVKYMISGHDPIHNRALVESPDGLSDVEQIISAGAGTELYGPASLADFGDIKSRETQISQEVYNIGYYIYTVDGPRVTVDYYSDSTGNFNTYSADSFSFSDFDFVKKETWGYSNNGQQFLIASGEPYTVVKDSFKSTKAKIIGGVNSSTATDSTPEEVDDNGTPDDPDDDIILSSPRSLIKSVNTGWIEKPRKQKNMFGSDILSLWGMADFGTGKTDTYVLSMSYKFKRGWHFRKGLFGIAALDSRGRWRNAVDLNYGGKKRFKIGPYKPWYKLGTYGIDPKTKTVWAVINYDADFAVKTGIDRASFFDRWIKWRLNRIYGRGWK